MRNLDSYTLMATDPFTGMLCDVLAFGSCASWNVHLILFPCILGNVC